MKSLIMILVFALVLSYVYADEKKPVKTDLASLNKRLIELESWKSKAENRLKKLEAKNNKLVPTLKVKKSIFKLVVKYQDDGKGDTKAYELVAKVYKITVDEVRKIVIEGVTNNWSLK